METGCDIFAVYYNEFSPHIHYAKILKNDSRPEPTKKQHAWHSPEKKNRLRKSFQNVSSTENLRKKIDWGTSFQNLSSTENLTKT